MYRTVHSEVLGWIVSRITGKHFADLMSERIWQKLGMEEDAYVMVDSVGTPLQGAGLCATARDLARFGEMLRRGGEFNGRRVFDQAVIDDLRQGRRPGKIQGRGNELPRPATATTISGGSCTTPTGPMRPQAFTARWSTSTRRLKWWWSSCPDTRWPEPVSPRP